jgi:hypothetical protein
MIRGLSLALLVMLAFLPAASACPNCKEAVAAAGDQSDDDPLREARAYNYSIYFMLAVPYSLLGVGGAVGYRMYRGQRRDRPADV